MLERDEYGDDLAIPVTDACRDPGCAAYPRAGCVLYVHVVESPTRRVLEYWTYYPRSQTDHLPLPALQGFHHDDWEGLLVAFSAGGRLEGARGSAHLGWNGSAPWWDEQRDNWAPYGGVVYRAAGSHALGLQRGDLDLAGDGWNGDLAVVPAGSCDLRAADRAGRRARTFDPGAVAPWDKQAWADPGVEHTGPPGSSRRRRAGLLGPGRPRSRRRRSASGSPLSHGGRLGGRRVIHAAELLGSRVPCTRSERPLT